MRCMFKGLTKFLIAWVAMTILCTITWEFVADGLYDCTDDGLPGYWTPCGWVHSWDDHPIVAVNPVVHGREMSEPDTIKAGWSVNRLLGLWFLFFIVSLIVSLALARRRWIPGQRVEQPAETSTRINAEI